MGIANLQRMEPSTSPSAPWRTELSTECVRLIRDPITFLFRRCLIRTLQGFSRTIPNSPRSGGSGRNAAWRPSAAPAPRRLRNGSSLNNCTILCAMASASPAGVRKPVCPSTICSEIPLTAVATTGVPHDRASRMTLGNVSTRAAWM